MTERAPIHLGSGEPMVLLHPFMMSQNVWKDVAPLIAETGRYEVFAPTMPGHNGGAKGPFFLGWGALADDVERRMDALGWDTAHIVGNSLGGWVAFELERRGRARTLTGIAPAGGWRHFTPAKFEIVGKFVAGLPVWLVTLALGPRVMRLPVTRRIAYLPISGTADALSDEDLRECIDDFSHCPAYYQMLVKSLLLPGLLELAQGTAPTHLVIREKDRVLPHPRYTRQFTTQLPKDTKVTHLDGVGHIPMFEAPGRVTEVILDFVDACDAAETGPPARRVPSSGCRRSRRGTPRWSANLLGPDQQRQVLGHLAALDGADDDLLQRVGELDHLGGVVQLAAVLEAPGPREDRRDRVRRRGLALLVLAIVPGDGAVRGLGLDGLAVRRQQHRRHQAQRAETLCDGVGLDVTVVVLTRPDVAALPLQAGGDHIVDQPVLVGEPLGVELFLVLLVEDALELVLEHAVVALEDGVLRRQVHRIVLLRP